MELEAVQLATVANNEWLSWWYGSGNCVVVARMSANKKKWKKNKQLNYIQAKVGIGIEKMVK